MPKNVKSGAGWMKPEGAGFGGMKGSKGGKKKATYQGGGGKKGR